MSTKTDLAKEIIDKKSPVYAKTKKKIFKTTEVTEITIETDEESALIGKPKGRYVTVEADSVRELFGKFDEEAAVLAAEISKMLPEKGGVLVAGMGNAGLTADSLGPLAAERVFCGGFSGRRLMSFSPGVLGKTGIEPSEMLSALAKKTHPAAVILIDSLAAENILHICRTIQLTDSGLAPGSGLGGGKTALCKEFFGVPTVAIGTPTVIRYPDSDSVFVSPNDIDVLIKRAAALIAAAIDLAVFPELGIDIIKESMI